MTTFREIRDEILADSSCLAREAEIVYQEVVIPGWGSQDRHGFPRTMYGYLKSGFAMIDLLSWLMTGLERPQTPRMRQFMISYLGASERAAAIAVQLWRHTLMHTGNPRVLRGRTSDHRFFWLLHWSDHLGRDGHMEIVRRGPGEEILNIGMLYFLEDLHQAAMRMFADHDTSTGRRHVEETWGAILDQTVDL